MRRRLTYLGPLLAGVLLLVPIAIAQGQDQGVQLLPSQDVVSVSIGDNYFDPAYIAIESGTTVTWTNDGQMPHTVTADDGSFDSEELNPGDSYTLTFSGSGVLPYYCEVHPWMVGSVTVGGDVEGGEAAPTTEQYESMETSSDY